MNLGGKCMIRWDEARYAVSSYEMVHGSNPFVVTYLNEPSQDSPKPPLLHWFQSICIAIFGFNEMAVRLPSALSGLLLCFVIMYFSIKKFNSFSLGAISTLLLLATPSGFCGLGHSARTADYDAMLTLFSFTGILYFFLYNQQKQNHKYLFLTFVFLALAVLTKAAAGLFFVPGMLLYTVAKRNFIATVKTKWLYISIAFFVGVVGFILLIREHFSPGYLQALNDMELMGRHNTTKDGHTGDAWYYYAFLKERFGYFFLFIPVSWVVGLSCKEEKVRDLSLFSFILTTTFYVLLSSAQTKINWYCLPLFPLLALQCSILIWAALKHLSNLMDSKMAFNKIISFYLCAVLFLFIPYKQTVSAAIEKRIPEAYLHYDNLQYYLRQEKEIVKNGTLVASRFDTQGHYLFYFYKLNEKGFNLKYKMGYTYYKPGDKLIVEDISVQQLIERYYSFTILDTLRHLKVYMIIGDKAVESPNAAMLVSPTKTTVNIMAPNGNYLHSDGHLEGLIFASSKEPALGEKFIISEFPKQLCTLNSFENKYASAELQQNGKFTANKISIGPSEIFSKAKLVDDYFAFVAGNGKYLSLDEKSLMLFAKADTVGKNERFRIVPAN
jgi:hypothetical protein